MAESRPSFCSGSEPSDSFTVRFAGRPRGSGAAKRTVPPSAGPAWWWAADGPSGARVWKAYDDAVGDLLEPALAGGTLKVDVDNAHYDMDTGSNQHGSFMVDEVMKY